MPKINVFGHFVEYQSFKGSEFLHDGGRQWGASFESGAIFEKNLMGN